MTADAHRDTPLAPMPLDALCCPRCRGALAADGIGDVVLRCAECARIYPVLHGIPDLRVGDDPYLTIEEDRRAAARLAARFASCDFESLFRSYYEGNEKVPPAQVARFTGASLAAVDRSRAMLSAWLASDPDGPATSTHAFLDIGCGTGPLTAVASERYRAVVGVDVGLRWLVLAKRRLQDAGAHVSLVCACAEALPFRSGRFQRAAAESVLENVRDQDAALREAARVLGSEGQLWLTTPNRYSLGPDPHLGLPAGGLLGPGAVRWYARRKGIIPPRRRLVGARALTRALTRAGFEDVRLALPDIPDAQRATLPGPLRVAVDVYHRVKRVPLAAALLRLIGPMLQATARRRRSPRDNE